MQRTGIRQRHIAADGEVTSDLAIHAAKAALASAHVDAQSIDLIVLATSTPDKTFPASAVSVQAGLGITRGAAFDLQAVCSGFVYGIAIADGLLRTGTYKRALVIGAETFSRILDWTDRTTCVLFGDGAGAVVMEAQQQPGGRDDRGVLTTHLRSDGRHKSKLYVDGGPSSTQTVGHLRMEGRAVFKHAVAMITDVIEDAFRATGYHRRRHRLVRAAPGQQAHHRRLRPQARHRAGEGGHNRELCTATPRRPRSRWRSTWRSRTAASKRAISSCSKPWAADSPGARR